MKIIPDAKMVDIKIFGIPFSWNGLVSKDEQGTSDNSDSIWLIHEPSGTKYRVHVNSNVSGIGEVSALKAKAKLEFIHHLHGESWLLDGNDAGS